MHAAWLGIITSLTPVNHTFTGFFVPQGECMDTQEKLRINVRGETREYPLQTVSRPVPHPPAVIDVLPGGDIDVSRAILMNEGAIEHTSGIDRAHALVIRLVPFTVIWFVLSIAVGFAAQLGVPLTFLLFAALTACTYAYMDRTEYQHSRNGIERHKINTIARLKREEMRHKQELRRMALAAHLRALGVDDD